MLTINRMIWGVMILGLVWLIAACGGQTPQEDIAPLTGLESPNSSTSGGTVALTVTVSPPASVPDEPVESTVMPAEAPDMGHSSVPVETTTPGRGSSSPTVRESAMPADSEPLVAMAKADLADRLTVPTEKIMVLLVEAVEWPDASLDCPQEGVMYAQVITSGYRIMLQVEGETYEYHTNETDVAVLCQPEAMR